MLPDTTQADSAPAVPFHAISQGHAERQLAAIDEALGTLAVQDRQRDDHCLTFRLESPELAERARVIVRGRLQLHHQRIALWLTAELGVLGSFPLTPAKERAIADYAHRIAEVYTA